MNEKEIYDGRAEQ